MATGSLGAVIAGDMIVRDVEVVREAVKQVVIDLRGVVRYR